MSSNTANTKRIAKNTMFLYIRMLFLMIITFITSRIVLKILGVEDFGIYNVVGGLSSLFVFFRSSLANVTQRYLNIELGKNNIQGASNVFCLHQTIYIVIAIIIVIVAEILGLWLLYNKLVIPAYRFTAALWVFQLTVISMVVTILSVVYNSAIVAHEDMKIYSYTGIYEGLAKLGIAYAISLFGFDRLITFQFLNVFVSFSIFIFYFSYCRKRYSECFYHVYWNKKEAVEASSLVSWNTIGTIVWTINDQGINILLNMFFGPAVNAARGISFQVNHAVNTFGTSFLTSVNPQMVKSYATKDFEYLYKLFFSSSKYAAFLLWILCLPMMLCIDQFLNIWLVDVPEYTNTFVIWILAYSMVNILNQPIWTLSLAVGKLKYYILIGSSVFFMAFPISYVCLRMGYSPECVFITMFIVRIVYIIVVFNIIQKYISISKIQYLEKVLIPLVSVIMVSGTVGYSISNLFTHDIVGCIIICSLVGIITLTSIWFIGLTYSERQIAKDIAKKKLLKR